jgi:hypothetical protein
MEKSFHDPCAVQATATCGDQDHLVWRHRNSPPARPRGRTHELIHGLWSGSSVGRDGSVAGARLGSRRVDIPPVTQPCVEDKSSPILGVASDTQVRV